MYSINHVLRYFKFIFLGVVLLISCDNGENSVNEKLNTTQQNPEIPLLAVKPPIPGLDIPFKTYSISTSKGYTIETPKGTTVDIPANAFVDKNGKTITGDVDIKFREFHDASEIIASGIPMHNPQTGEFMETAGMFEIKGEYEGEEIFIKGDKEIQVNLASYNEGDNFNFYKLGSKDCRWEEKGTAKATVNLNKKVRLLELENKMAQKPIGPRKHKNIKNYVFDLQVNYDMYPELKPFKGIVWEYAGKGEDPEKNNWIFSSNWDEINLNQNPTGYYELVLTNSKKKFTTLVRPVLNDKDYDKALALFNQSKLKEYNKIKAEQLAERKRLDMQADIQRNFSINGFGIYNWDVWHNPDRTKCIAKPQFDELAKVDINNTNISYFLVSKGRKAVVKYSNETLAKFSFNPSDNNSLLAVLPEGKVAIFSAYDFKQLDVEKIKNSDTLMRMATSTKTIKSLDDLNTIIDHAMS